MTNDDILNELVEYHRSYLEALEDLDHFHQLEAELVQPWNRRVLGYAKRREELGTRLGPMLERAVPIVNESAPAEALLRRGVETGSITSLLNTILTVHRGIPGSHRRFGWQTFTDAVLAVVTRKPDPVVFLLWGKVAQSKAHLVVAPHVALSAPHPVARSANGFLGQSPFSKANAALAAAGQRPIVWDL